MRKLPGQEKNHLEGPQGVILASHTSEVVPIATSQTAEPCGPWGTGWTLREMLASEKGHG